MHEQNDNNCSGGGVQHMLGRCLQVPPEMVSIASIVLSQDIVHTVHCCMTGCQALTNYASALEIYIISCLRQEEGAHKDCNIAPKSIALVDCQLPLLLQTTSILQDPCNLDMHQVHHGMPQLPSSWCGAISGGECFNSGTS